MRASALLEHQEVAALRHLWPRDEGNAALPAAGSDPELRLRVEELHLGDLVLDLDRLDVGVVVDEGAGVEVVDLHFSCLEGDQEELVVDVRAHDLSLLSLDLLERVVPVVLIGLAITYAVLGLFGPLVIWRTVMLVIPFIVGIFISAKLFPLASERTFRNIALAVLAVSSGHVLLA